MRVYVDISDILEKDQQRNEKIIKRIVEEADNLSIDLAMEELSDIYKQIIDQYYRYETVRYVRHGEPSAGTCHGQNLYNAFHLDVTHGNTHHVDLDINGDNMDGYVAIGANHSHIQTTFVVDTILSGLRPMPPWYQPFEPFEVSVTQAHLGNYVGTPDQILSGEKLKNALKKYRQELYDDMVIETLAEYRII